MNVQCVICDKQSDLDSDSPLAKKLRNRPIHTYMCPDCHDRIKLNTESRLSKDNFQLYKYNKKHKEF